MRILTVALATSIALLPAACSDRPLLRDDYLGKRILQPDRVPQVQEHDGDGNPIIRKREE